MTAAVIIDASHDHPKRTWVSPALILIVTGVAFYFLHVELKNYHYRDVTHALFSLRSSSVIAALALTLLAYAILPFYDLIALRYVGSPLPMHRVAFSSIISYGLSQTLGFPLV